MAFFSGYPLCVWRKEKVEVKALFYCVLLPAALVSGLVLGELTWYALRGATPRLPVPEPLVVIDACMVCLVAMVVAIILDIRWE
jgi:hypothetical protein